VHGLFIACQKHGYCSAMGGQLNCTGKIAMPPSTASPLPLHPSTAGASATCATPARRQRNLAISSSSAGVPYLRSHQRRCAFSSYDHSLPGLGGLVCPQFRSGTRPGLAACEGA